MDQGILGLRSRRRKFRPRGARHGGTKAIGENKEKDVYGEWCRKMLRFVTTDKEHVQKRD